MQLPILCGIAAFLPWCESIREPQGHGWQAAKTGDSRSPCPMLNSLANHGYLPRDGHNIDAQTATSVLTDALNFDPAPFVGQIQGVMKVSTTGKNGTFNLVDLNQKPFEHDASLSRNEAFSGDSLHFDPKVWAQIFSHFRGKDIITIQMAAEARADRVATAMKTNPDFNLTEAQVSTTYAESGLYLMAFGDKTNGNARTDWVRSFFEHERLPYNQGWNKPRETVLLADVQAMAQKVAAVPVGK